MKIKKINAYNSAVDSGVDNLYPTPDNSFKQPCLHMIVGQRNSGKSHLTSLILEQAYKDKTFDVVYIITPSFNSNKAYFGKYINEENVFDPTKDSINNVLEKVEADRDEWERYLEEKAKYKMYLKEIKTKNPFMNDWNLLEYNQYGFLDGVIPKWKYETEEPPKSLLILDDVIGSPALNQSSNLNKIATLNRHLLPLKEPYKGRSACGLAVIILAQSYRMQNGVGRLLREQVSLLTLFKNKQQKQLDAIKDELANVVDEDLFMKAYDYATKDKYGNLTIDFNNKCATKTFRKNLNELIMFDELPCECNK